MNKRGKGEGYGWLGPVVVFVLILIFMVIMDNFLGDKFDIWPGEVLTSNLNKGDVSFEKIFNGNSFAWLDYVFGKVPQYLVDTTGNDKSAGIVIIALWITFFLIFADIFYLFGNFSDYVRWPVAALLALIGANVKVISAISVYFLTLFAIFGSLSILFSIGFVFVLFILFHFGGSGIRGWIMMRRAEDSALRAVAGGKVAASGIEVLEQIAKKAKDAERNK